MKHVLMAYDVRMLKDEEAKLAFLRQLCELHGTLYSRYDSYGEIKNAKIMFIAEFTNMSDSVVARTLTFDDLYDFRDWWGYKGPILPATFDNYNIGGL